MKKFLYTLLSLVFIFILMPIISVKANALDYRVEAAIKWAVDTANDNKHGYSQSNRTGPNYDCSSLVSTAFKTGGFPVKGTLTTSTMSTPFMNAGFKRYTKGSVNIQRGDILLKPGSHVELYLGDSTCVGAHSNYDGKSGDSSGKEIAVRDISKCSFCKNKGYTYVLRYEGVIGAPGDVNMNGHIEFEDAVQLLMHANFPELYPIESEADYDKNGVIDYEDAIYLLMYMNFPDDYPLSK